MSARSLVVENEEALPTLLSCNLEAEGYEVETVARGEDADMRLMERVCGPDRAGLDAAGPVGHRAVPAREGS